MWPNSTILLTPEYTISSLPPAITMASAPARAPLSEPIGIQSSEPGLTPVNRPSNEVLFENQDSTSIFKALLTITVVISTLLSGVAAAAILSKVSGFLATDINPTHKRDDFLEIVLLVSGLSSFLLVGKSRRMWLVGSGTLCPLILACGFARNDNHFFILHTLMGLLLAVILPISWRFIESSVLSPGLMRDNIRLVQERFWASVLYRRGISVLH